MSDAFKAAHKAYAQGYRRALSLGILFAAAVVLLFAALVIANPLGLSYYEFRQNRIDDALDCWSVYPDPDGLGKAGEDCVQINTYEAVHVTTYYFALSIVLYAALTFVPALVVFSLLFGTDRRMRQMVILLAAQKTLGLLEEEKKE